MSGTVKGGQKAATTNKERHGSDFYVRIGAKGGQKAATTNKERHGSDFYVRIGAKGGRNGHAGGFASDKVGEDGLTGRQRAALVGAIGGLRSSRAGVKNGEGKKWQRAEA